MTHTRQVGFIKGHIYLIASSPLHSHCSLSQYLLTHAHTVFHNENAIPGIGEVTLGETGVSVGTTLYSKEKISCIDYLKKKKGFSD